MKPLARRIKPWMLLLPLGAGLVVAGIWQGEPLDTMAKAARICLECIGIG